MWIEKEHNVLFLFTKQGSWGMWSIFLKMTKMLIKCRLVFCLSFQATTLNPPDCVMFAAGINVPIRVK